MPAPLDVFSHKILLTLAIFQTLAERAFYHGAAWASALPICCSGAINNVLQKARDNPRPAPLTLWRRGTRQKQTTLLDTRARSNLVQLKQSFPFQCVLGKRLHLQRLIRADTWSRRTLTNGQKRTIDGTSGCFCRQNRLVNGFSLFIYISEMSRTLKTWGIFWLKPNKV